MHEEYKRCSFQDNIWRDYEMKVIFPFKFLHVRSSWPLDRTKRGKEEVWMIRKISLIIEWMIRKNIINNCYCSIFRQSTVLDVLL
jgi:hypothetical protein